MKCLLSCILITLLITFYIRHMTEMSKMCNPYIVSEYTRDSLDFIKFSIERIRHFAISSRHFIAKRSSYPRVFHNRHDFCRHIPLVSCTPTLYISNVERDDTGGMQFTVFPVICPALAVRALPKRRHLGPRRGIRAVVRSVATTGEGPTEWPHAILNYFNEMG